MMYTIITVIVSVIAVGLFSTGLMFLISCEDFDKKIAETKNGKPATQKIYKTDFSYRFFSLAVVGLIILIIIVKIFY